jgi:hypothetical protein
MKSEEDLTMGITKAKVLEVFLRHYNRLAELPEKRRLVEADSATLDELAPWREGMSPEERAPRDSVSKFIDEILTEDFGLRVVETRSLTPFEDEVSKIGFAAGQEFLSHNSHLVPQFPFEEAGNAEWGRKMEAFALDAVPRKRLSEKEWTKNFIAAFVGELFMHQRDRH